MQSNYKINENLSLKLEKLFNQNVFRVVCNENKLDSLECICIDMDSGQIINLINGYYFINDKYNYVINFVTLGIKIRFFRVKPHGGFNVIFDDIDYLCRDL